MIVEESEFIYYLNDYHGTIGNFLTYLEAKVMREQADKITKISIYTMLKQFTGVSIPKLEQFFGIAQKEDNTTLEEAKEQFVSAGISIEG